MCHLTEDPDYFSPSRRAADMMTLSSVSLLSLGNRKQRLLVSHDLLNTVLSTALRESNLAKETDSIRKEGDEKKRNVKQQN